MYVRIEYFPLKEPIDLFDIKYIFLKRFLRIGQQEADDCESERKQRDWVVGDLRKLREPGDGMSGRFRWTTRRLWV